MTRFAPLFLLGFAACAPQSAELSEGTVVGWLNEDTSFTVLQWRQALQTGRSSGFFDPGSVDENWRIDCRVLDDENAFLELDDTLDICDFNRPQGGVPGGNGDDNTTYNWPETESWLANSAWHGFKLPLEPWRGEGIRTREGDLQVGFHHRLPGGEDFRFAFAIDPDFNPTYCGGPDGITPVPVDEEPWLDQWAADWASLSSRTDLPPFLESAVSDFPEGRLYLLNARAYQFDVENLDNPNIYVWSLPEEWNAGFARGTFGQEDMHSRPTRFGTPAVYLEADAENFVALPRDQIWYGNCEAGEDAEDCGGFVEDRSLSRQYARVGRRDLETAVPEGVEVDYIAIAPDNSWRPIDSAIAGIDQWSQMDYSWVVLDPTSDTEVGGSVTGAFSILMDPDDSNSRFIIQGRFTVPKVKKERWAGPDLYAEKLEEAGVDLCIQ